LLDVPLLQTVSPPEAAKERGRVLEALSAAACLWIALDSLRGIKDYHRHHMNALGQLSDHGAIQRPPDLLAARITLFQQSNVRVNFGLALVISRNLLLHRRPR